MTETNIVFYKMSGCGNDFILVDNREGVVPEKNLRHWIASLCRRKQSVGADGLILIERSDRADFKWRFFNADGGEVDMCGNGGRCVARLAYLKGIAGPSLSFETMAGVIRADVADGRVKLEMPKPSEARIRFPLDAGGRAWVADAITVGVPHAVFWVEDVETAPVVEIGRAVRHHILFAPAGTNVNFVEPLKNNLFAIRTYERGVEDETLACGTGSVAAALIAALKGMAASPVFLRTRGGEILTIHFERDEGGFRSVFLEGDARLIYEGRLWSEAL